MNLPCRQVVLLLALAVLSMPAAVRSAEGQASSSLVLEGIKSDPVRYSLADLRRLPLHKVRVEFESGRSGECEGVRLDDILVHAGLAMGKAIRGQRLSEYVVVRARDGYAAVFALAELDPAFGERPVLLCLAMDGAPIGDDFGPLQVVVPHEKRHARWVRQVSAIAVQKAP